MIPFFFEQDPSLSYPYIPDSAAEVPTLWAIIISLPFPMIIIFIVQLILRCTVPEQALKDEFQHIQPLFNLFLSQLAFLESFGMQVFITEFLKCFIGRKRPNFFGYCNYKGYRDAFLSSNFTDYYQNTNFGTPGSISFCLDQKGLIDASKSFPSGHASVVWSGYAFLGIFLLAIIKSQYPKQNMLKGLVAFLVIFVAIIVTGTRPRDYWHNPEDILGSAVIGLSCAIYAFILNFSQDKKKSSDETSFLLTRGH